MHEKSNRSKPLPRLVGCARVSTSGQTLEAQIEQLTAAGCRPIFRETASGAKADRRELAKLLRDLQPGDGVTVTRIDRLAHSMFDLFRIVRDIAEAGAHFRSLAEPMVDTHTSTGRMILAVLGGMADIERDVIKTRTAEGRARAKAKGKSLGRPRKLTADQPREALERIANREHFTEIAPPQRATASDNEDVPPSDQLWRTEFQIVGFRNG